MPDGHVQRHERRRKLPSLPPRDLCGRGWSHTRRSSAIPLLLPLHLLIHSISFSLHFSFSSSSSSRPRHLHVLVPKLNHAATGQVGATMCTECMPGTSSQPGSISCDMCPVGKFTDYTGAAECQNCPAGRVGAYTGATSCAPAPTDPVRSSNSVMC